MPRLTITLPKTVYNRLSVLSMQSNDSMSSFINRLIGVGMCCMTDDYQSKQNNSEVVEQHCQHLIIQMNALIKNMSSEMLKFNQEDFEKLRQAAVIKYNELIQK